MKLKVGFGVEEDAAMTHAVRDAIGDDVALMVDANHAYDAVAAIRLGRMIEHHDIGWFEEPVPPEDIAGYRAVKAAISIPVAGGECEFTRFGFRELLASRAVDIVQPDTCAAGGLSECKKIADMAEAFGVRYNPHVWGTGIAIAASLQLLAVLPSHTPASLKPAEPMLEFDRTEHPIRQALLTQPIEHVRGVVRVPDGPGSASRWIVRHWRVLRWDEWTKACTRYETSRAQAKRIVLSRRSRETSRLIRIFFNPCAGPFPSPRRLSFSGSIGFVHPVWAPSP